jgi:hypothetical protein
VFAKPESPVVHAGGGHGFGIGPILSILELSRSPSNSSCGNRSATFALHVCACRSLTTHGFSLLYRSVATSQGYTTSGLLMVLPVDFAEEEALLPRIRYKLETLYPAQREFAVCQLLSDVSALLCYYTRMQCFMTCCVYEFRTVPT